MHHFVLDGIRRVTAFARDHEDEFAEMGTKKTRIELDKSMRDGGRVQRIKIVYKCIGEFDLSVSTSTTEKEKSA
jgi:hypothetical protein